MVDRAELKYQIRSPYGLLNAFISTDEGYNDCCLLHSTILAQSSDEFLKIIYGTEVSILQRLNSILLTPERAKVLPTLYPREFVVSHQPAAKQNSSWDRSPLSGTQQKNVIYAATRLKESLTR